MIAAVDGWQYSAHRLCRAEHCGEKTKRTQRSEGDLKGNKNENEDEDEQLHKELRMKYGVNRNKGEKKRVDREVKVNRSCNTACSSVLFSSLLFSGLLCSVVPVSLH